jgi:hypothetical protein
MKSMLVFSLMAMLVLPSIALSGSAHFVSCAPVVSGDEVCVTGKESGLGNLDQVDIHLSIIAHCRNRGGNDPSAQNKETFSTDSVQPVQNGRALYEICLETSFKPPCDPPMSVVVDAVTLIDETNGISCSQASQ